MPIQLISEPERGELETAYTTESQKALQMDPSTFARRVGGRIYTEWCTNEGRSERHWSYEGAAYTQWISDEIHFALERLVAQTKDHQTYLQVREKVIEAVVRRAAHLFSSWDGNNYPKDHKDTQNLRAPLVSWMKT